MFKFRKTIAGIAVAGLLAFGGFASGVLPALAQSIGSIFIAQNGLPNAPSVYGAGSNTSGLYFTTTGAGFSRHVLGGSTATNNLPVVSTCGTGAALVAGSTDHAGKITVGTTASNACTLTFGTTYGTAPTCIVQNLTTGAAANVYAVSATAIVWSSALADSTTLHYICVGIGG